MRELRAMWRNTRMVVLCAISRGALCRGAGAVQGRAADPGRHRAAPGQRDSGGVLVSVRARGGVGFRDRQHDRRLLRRRRPRRHLRLFRQPRLRLYPVQSLERARGAAEPGQPFAGDVRQVRRRPVCWRACFAPISSAGATTCSASAVLHARQRHLLQQHALRAGALAADSDAAVYPRVRARTMLYQRRDAGATGAPMARARCAGLAMLSRARSARGRSAIWFRPATGCRTFLPASDGPAALRQIDRDRR